MARTRLTLLSGRVGNRNKYLSMDKMNKRDRDKFDEIQQKADRARAKRENDLAMGLMKPSKPRGLTAGDRAFFGLVQKQNNGTLTVRATTGSTGG